MRSAAHFGAELASGHHRTPLLPAETEMSTPLNNCSRLSAVIIRFSCDWRFLHKLDSARGRGTRDSNCRRFFHLLLPHAVLHNLLVRNFTQCWVVVVQRLTELFHNIARAVLREL